MKELKQLIKNLAIEQRELKSQRKTGTLPEFKRDYFGYPIDVPGKIKKAWGATSSVQMNKPRITAALNLYHELRGSSYRHNIRDDQGWAYDKALKELKKRFAVETVE